MVLSLVSCGRRLRGGSAVVRRRSGWRAVPGPAGPGTWRPGCTGARTPAAPEFRQDQPCQFLQVHVQHGRVQPDAVGPFPEASVEQLGQLRPRCRRTAPAGSATGCARPARRAARRRPGRGRPGRRRARRSPPGAPAAPTAGCARLRELGGQQFGRGRGDKERIRGPRGNRPPAPAGRPAPARAAAPAAAGE